MITKITSVAIVIMFTVPALAQQACDPVLALRTTSLRTMTKRAQLSWMKLIDQATYSQVQQEGKALIPGYFDGSYQSFDEKRQKLFKEENYNSSTYEASVELRVEVPEGVTTAWLECMQSSGTGLFSYTKDVDETGATLRLVWHPAPGLGPLREVKVDMTGVQSSNSKFELSQLDGDQRFIINRATPNAAVRGVVKGIAGQNGSYSTDIYIPTRAPHDHLRSKRAVTAKKAYGVRWETQKASPEWLVEGVGPTTLNFRQTYIDMACIEASSGWSLIRSTVKITPPNVGACGHAVCPENENGAAPQTSAADCRGNENERRICFITPMSINKGDPTCIYPWEITGEEIAD